MKVRIYQINLDRDPQYVCFRNLETVLKRCNGTVPAEAYDMVFEYEALSNSLERLFYIFNEAHPKGYKARSMSMSDVVEVIDPENGSKFYFCDDFGFKEISFDASKAKGGPTMLKGWGKTVGITPSTRVKFKCQGCGKCCTQVKEGVPVDSQDVFRITKYLRDKGENILCTDDFLAKYAEPVLLDECGYFVYMLKAVGEENACIFLKDNRCMIHDENPRACRLYPFVVNPDPRGLHSYLLSREYPHHFTGPVVQTKSWMKTRFPKEDRQFLQTDFGEAKPIADLLRKLPEGKRTQAVLYFHRMKYSNFDLDQPFLEQYRRNHDKLVETLNRMTEENK